MRIQKDIEFEHNKKKWTESNTSIRLAPEYVEVKLLQQNTKLGNSKSYFLTPNFRKDAHKK